MVLTPPSSEGGKVTQVGRGDIYRDTNLFYQIFYAIKIAKILKNIANVIFAYKRACKLVPFILYYYTNLPPTCQEKPAASRCPLFGKMVLVLRLKARYTKSETAKDVM